MSKYPLVVEKSADGITLGMYFPDFPGTAILAYNLAGGMKQAKEMLASRLAGLEASGVQAPIPSQLIEIELLSEADQVIFIEP